MAKEQKITVKKGFFLNSVLNKIPYGIINKSETGIGATTLELEAKRNSIIVQPLKVTASSKAHKHKAFYVGSPTLLFKKKIQNKDILNYLTDNSIKFKKIVVVADSLSRVIELIPKGKLNDYFLMIDESDSFQLDSKFRNVMETCYEIYKQHPYNRRCLITATPLKFSDPELKNEKETIISYDKIEKKEITIYHTNNNKGLLIDKIKEILINNPDDCIVVALNNVTILYSIANMLELELSVNEKDISILCGSNSREKAGKYYKELIGSNLPSKIVLKTSAYFTGFDIDNQYHLFTLVNNTDILNCLSELKIKQISGRCRAKKGLLSNTVLQEFTPQKLQKISKARILKAAQLEIDSLNCINNTFKKSSILKKQVISIRELIVGKTNFLGFNLVKFNYKTSIASISYLNIDAVIELLRIQNEVYNEKTTLAKKLNSIGYVVTEKNEDSTTVLTKKELKIDKKKLIGYIESSLVTKDPQFIQKTLNEDNLSEFEQITYNGFIALLQYVDSDYLIEKLLELVDNKTTYKLRKFIKTAELVILEDKSLFKQALMSQFTVGETYDIDQITEKISRMLEKLGISIDELDDRVALKVFNRFVEHTRNHRKGTTAKTIKGFNPQNLPIIKFKSEFPDADETFQNIFGEL